MVQGDAEGFGRFPKVLIAFGSFRRFPQGSRKALKDSGIEVDFFPGWMCFVMGLCQKDLV